MSEGFKVEVETALGEWSRNGQVWPDWDSADKAGHNLMMRWTLVRDYRVVKVDKEPNESTWEEYIAKYGPPPARVTL